MSSITDRFGDPFGSPSFSTKGFTPEQIAEREEVFNAPLAEGLYMPRELDPSEMGEDYNPFDPDRPMAPAPSLSTYKPGRLDAAEIALNQDNFIGAIGNYFEERNLFPKEGEFAPDPDFNHNDHLAIYDLVSPDYFDELNEATSKEDLYRRAQYYGRLTKDAEYLDTLGVEGVGYRVASLMLDLPFTQVIKLAKGVKLTRGIAETVDRTYLGRALVAGTVEGGLEGIKMSLAPHTRDEADMLLAVGLGGALGGLFKSGTYTDDVQGALMGPVRDLGNEIAANGGKLVIPQKTLSTLDKLQVNVATVLRTSKSPTLARFGDEAFLDVTRAAPAQVKAAEVQTAIIDGIQAEFNLRFTPLYKDFLKETQGNAVGARYRITSQDDFYELVGQVANQPNRNWEGVISPELLAKIRKANEEMGEAAYDVLQRNGHEMFTNGVIKRGEYLPRKWNRAKLLEDINEGRFGLKGKEEASKMFAAGIRSAVKQLGYDLTDEKVAEAGKKFVDSLTKTQVRAGQAGFIMEDNAFRKAIDDVREILNLDAQEAEMLERALQGRRASKSIQEGTASATRKRGDVDVEAKYISADGTEHVLSDYLENNVQSLWMSYGRQMGGDTALRKMGINSRVELAKMRAKVEKELTGPTGQLDAAGKRDLANFDAVIGDFLNISGKHDPDGNLWKATRIANNLTRSSKLGATWFAMSAELAQVVATNGVVSVMKAVPELARMSKVLRGPKSQELLDEIQSFYNLGDEILQMPSAARIDEMYTAGANKGRLAKAEAISDRAAEAAYILGGTKSGTSVLETLFATSANNRIAKMAAKKRLSASDKWLLDQMGFLGDASKANLLNNVRNNADAGNKYLLNLSKWSDGETAQKLAYGMRRVSNIAVQRGNIGDQLGRFTVGGQLIKDNALGAMAMNLRNYMLTAWNKQFSRMVGQSQRGGYERWQAFKNIMYQMVIVGGLGYSAKNGLDYAAGVIDDDEFEERMSPQAIAANTFNMTTFASFLPVGMDFLSSVATGETMSGRPVRGGSTNIAGATGGYLMDALGAVRTAGKALDPNREVTSYETRKALGLLPLSTMIGVKQGLAGLADTVTGE